MLELFEKRYSDIFVNILEKEKNYGLLFFLFFRKGLTYKFQDPAKQDEPSATSGRTNKQTNQYAHQIFQSSAA